MKTYPAIPGPSFAVVELYVQQLNVSAYDVCRIVRNAFGGKKIYICVYIYSTKVHFAALVHFSP